MSGKVLRHLQLEVLVAEARAEDDLVALVRQIAEHALRIRRFRHVLDARDLDLVAELRLGFLAAGVVREGPARIARIAQIDERDARRVGRLRARRAAWRTARCECRATDAVSAFSHVLFIVLLLVDVVGETRNRLSVCCVKNGSGTGCGDVRLMCNTAGGRHPTRASARREERLARATPAHSA